MRIRTTRFDPSASTEGLLDFIPRISPQFKPPLHLAPLVDALERAPFEPVRLLFSVPPRHFKTETIQHGIAWMYTRVPDLPVAYLSYAAQFAQNKARLARKYAERAGVQIGDRDALGWWDTASGGYCKSDSVHGQITGDGFKVVIVDDAHKNREESSSPVMCAKILAAFTSDILTRADYSGTSFIVNGTRWATNDLIGSLEKKGWRYVNMPAIGPDGDALAPEFWSAERLLEIKRDMLPYEWESLYMGRPMASGGAVFEGLNYYDAKPNTYSVAIGVDLAYTAKTAADRSVSLVLARSADKYYVLDCVAKQVKAPEFALQLKVHAAQYPNSPMLWYCSGTEQGSADFIQRMGVPLTTRPATSDKMQRAQPVAVAWNKGDVLLPRSAPWLDWFLSEVLGFTGVNDPHDDIVDALAAAFDALGSSRMPVYESHTPRVTAGLGRYL